MPQQPVVVVQQSQSQTQHGCCAGAGCGWLLLAVVVLSLLGAILEAMSGHYGLGWQIVSWVGAIMLVLLLVGGTVAALDQKFGWGLTNPPSNTPNTPQADTRTPEDVLGDDATNYGVAEPRSPQETEPGVQERRGQRQPHPDDPQRPQGMHRPKLLRRAKNRQSTPSS